MTQAVSLAIASLVASASAQAQAPALPAAASIPAPAAAPADEVATVLVVGARASQQTAIARKKNAATAQDSIIAEDIGAFPDRNVADAISRIAGVALDRGEYGEGVSVSIRGNGPELTRVELDGQGVQSAGGTDMLGGISAGTDGAAGRGVEMRQLSSDLIKSVDVVKGSTADMTEGSLGGGVIIKTNNGLDFKKPFYSLRIAASQTSINKKISPDMNLVLSNKFLDNRLGILLNVSKTASSNESHSINQGGQSSQTGAIRSLDFDNSPDKTFSFQPQTVRLDDPRSTAPVTTTPLTAGGTFNSATPLDLVTKSAAAANKQACYAAFPLLTPAQTALFTGNTNRNAAISARELELLTCLSQWNDYTPNLLRNFVNRQEDRRLSGDLRFDFKVSNELTVYAKYNGSRGLVKGYAHSSGMGGVNINAGSTATPTYSGPTFVDSAVLQANGAVGARSAIAGSGFYNYPDLTWKSGGAINGAVANMNPASVKVDANHRVTQFDISDGSYGTDSTFLDMDTASQYFQTGGTFKRGGFRAELMLGDAKSTFSRYERRQGFSYTYGTATVSILPNGQWGFAVPQGTVLDLSDPNLFYKPTAQAATTAVAATATTPAIPAYTSAQRPLVTGNPTLPVQNPRVSESHEKTAKLDLSYALNERVPYITTLKSGFNLRDSGYDFWGSGGATLQEPVGNQPGIYLPGSALRTRWLACENTPGSLGPGGQPCVYGYTPNANGALDGTMVLTPEQYKAAIAASISVPPNAQFYGSDPDRPAALTNGWTTVDINKLYDMIGAPNYNLNCIKVCMASDGKMVAQPVSAISEKVKSAYLMADFDIDHLPFSKNPLPFGMELSGNFGYRYVNTEVRGTGLLTFVSIKKTADYNPLDRNNPLGMTTSTYRKATAIKSTTRDFMPSFNLALWAIPSKVVLRYNRSKTIARPAAGRLLPNGTCTYDDRFIGELDTDGTERDQKCDGTMGNPELKPLTNRNQNLAVEWYVSKDTMLSASTYKQEGLIGAGTLVETVQGERLFEGSDAIDQQTGKPLSEFEFNYNHWINQLPNTRRGVEFSAKTALTFLPWLFKYTGVDANYTKNKSALTGTVVKDLLTGDVMPVSGEPKHSYNASLWYDDGALSARLALQVVAEVFSCISGCNSTAVNNYPTNGLTTVRGPAYNPAPSLFKRGTRYVDAKIAYKFKNGFELFAEGRNLGMAHTGTYTGPYANFADGTQNVLVDAFAGRRIMVGMNIKSLR